MLVENVKSKTANSLPTIKSEQMTVDSTATVFLMKAISENLYTFPAVACVRELLSNGLDSTSRAKSDRPVEVTLPTSLNPALVVQDFGTGMDGGTISRVYSKVFASDKRESNAERGGYGLGSKSPLALTASFSVVARKNGEERVIIVARDEDNIPVFHTVAVNPTDEPNGVTVSVPCSNEHIRELSENIDDILTTTPKNMVLLNGQYPKFNVHNPDQYIPISGYGWFKLTPSDSPCGEILGVRYTLGGNLTGGLLSDDLGKRAVLTLPNGDIKLETSRETIRSVEHNRDIISKLAEGWREGVLDYLQEHIDGLDRRNAYLFVKGFEKSYGLTVGDMEIPRELPYFLPTAVAANYEEQTESRKEQLENPHLSVPIVEPFGLYSVHVGLGSRPSAVRIHMDTKNDRFVPNDRTRCIIVKVDNDAESRRLAMRDLKDYELSRSRDEFWQSPRYFILTEKNGSMLSPWFLAFSEFVELQEVEEAAKTERRLRRQEAAARRAAQPKSESDAPKEPRLLTFSVQLPKASSDSKRARLDTITTPSDGLAEKVAYIVPTEDVEDETQDFGLDLARITSRTGMHPGRHVLTNAMLYVHILNSLGYEVVALRSTQKPESLEELEGIEAVDARDLVGVAHEVILKLFRDEGEMCSAIFKYTDTNISELMVRLGLHAGFAGDRKKLAKEVISRMSSAATYRDDDASHRTSATSFLSEAGVTEEDREEYLTAYQRVLDSRLSRRYPLLTSISHATDVKRDEHVRLYIQTVDSMTAE